MYTECPDCQTAFRLTARALRQAQGRVRCGGCGMVFNALDHLSEDLPGDASNTQTARVFDNQSRALLQTLDELSGRDEVRIEDTGVEWRVLDIDHASDNDSNDEDSGLEATGSIRWSLEGPDDALTDSATTAAADDGDDTIAHSLEVEDDAAHGEVPLLQDNVGTVEEAAEEPMRFDDHTPLPDDFYRPAEDPGFRPADESPPAPAADEPPAEPRADLNLGDGADDDWQDLLTEVETGGDEVEAETEAGIGIEDEAEIEVEAVVEPEAEIENEPEAVDVAPDDDELAVSADMEIDQELLRAEATSGEAEDAETDPPAAGERNMLVETIIMEGDTVTDLLTQTGETVPGEDFHVGEITLPGAEEVDEAESASGRKRRYAAIAAIVVLGLALAAQLVHANRAALATLDSFDSTLAPLYRAFGRPVTPAWDVRGWQFESTSGSTDGNDQRLTIHSRIANRSEHSLPYPLVHLSLTDRYEEVVGSRMLSPDDYLAGSGNPDRPLPAGATFTAVITVAAPSPDATGFKLNVCYPSAGDTARCAIEDFRD